ncbi:hypothetical protein CHGG_00247 [Chaetomium globosum CBS 148.51]|uniref:Uncharacterized protein n=1 Tax=Chaetomium globosum (strain ATCC 6205 / CBS 148.51 / DSM 1962 / NBRC 6347 / NRRL 1970) TaxID=306901 RepID=Q2HHQ7_CHAGB|nr:uncharacterized protein CHGG_00247 [Chaetomium globosum CBS 148.51]EAQ92012.1 hypothetical protein CHGG_00247 [Chaetomium globosum CBS 148.51]
MLDSAVRQSVGQGSTQGPPGSVSGAPGQPVPRPVEIIPARLGSLAEPAVL